jgi:hypothetical protein
MWGIQGAQRFGPAVSEALRSAGALERREAREYQQAAEALAEQRRTRAMAQFLAEHPEFEESFRQDMVRGVEPGLTVHERCALVAAQMDAADRAENRARAQRRTERAERLQAALMTGQVVPRSHADVLAIAAMDLGEAG